MASVGKEKEKVTWLSLNKQGLERLNSRKPVVAYLRLLMDDLVLGSDDTYCISLTRNTILFHCTYLSHCRILARMSALFLYKGLSFDECHIELEKGEIRSKFFSPLSRVVVITISLNEPNRNKCIISVKNNFSEDYKKN